MAHLRCLLMEIHSPKKALLSSQGCQTRLCVTSRRRFIGKARNDRRLANLMSNQPMKPMAPWRGNFSELVTDPPVAYLFLVRPLPHAPCHVRHRRHAYRNHEGGRGVFRSLIQGRVWFRRHRHRLVTLSTHDRFRYLSRCFHVTHWPATDGAGRFAISPAFHPIARYRFITVSICTGCRG